MESQPEAVGSLPRLAQQIRGIDPGRPEFVLKRNFAKSVRTCHPHEEREVLRLPGLCNNLVQLGFAVEGEAAHAIVEISAPNQLARFDGVHHMGADAGERGDLLDFGERGDIEVADARVVERAKHMRRIIRLDGVKACPRKILQKPARGPLGSVGPKG